MGLSNYLRTSVDDKRTYRNVGLLLVILAQVFGVGMNTCVKLLQSSDPPVPPFEIVFVRQIVTYSVSLYFLFRQGVPYPGMCLTWASSLRSFIHFDVFGLVTGPPEVRMLLVFRGLSGFLGTRKHLTRLPSPVLTIQQDSSEYTTAFSISHSPMPLQ